MKKYFPSAKNKSLGIIAWGILLVVFGITFYAVFKNSSTSSLIILSIIFIITILFVGIVWFGTGYFISGDYLIIKIGPFTHSRISISSISKISKSNSIISSPANSFNRLAIHSGQKVLVLISPRDVDEFIAAVSEINSGVTIEI